MMMGAAALLAMGLSGANAAVIEFETGLTAGALSADGTEGDYQFTGTTRFWRADENSDGVQDGVLLWDGHSFTLSRTDGAAFDLISFDVRNLLNTAALTITATYADGTTGIFGLPTAPTGLGNLSTVDMAAAGFNLTGLSQVVFSTAFGGARVAMDNIVVNASVPVPGAMLLFAPPIFGLAATRRRRATA